MKKKSMNYNKFEIFIFIIDAPIYLTIMRTIRIFFLHKDNKNVIKKR